jgi:hypothetical protein
MEVEHVPEKSEKQKKEKDQKKKKKHKKKKDKKQKNKDKKKKKKKKHKKARKDKKAKDRESESDDGDEVADRIIRSPMPEADRKLTGFIDLFEAAIAKYPEKGIFIDFYGGVGKVAARAESKYGLIGVNIDWQKDHAWDLHTQGVLPYISKKVSSGRVKGGHIATECTSFSSARHGKAGTNCPRPLRDYHENAWGFPGLCGKDLATLEKGNKDAHLTIGLIDVFEENQVPISVENGDNSILWHIPEIKERLENARIFKVDYCMMGRMYRKRTRLAAWALKNIHVAAQVEKQCQGEFHCLTKNKICCRTKKPHLLLRGWARGKAVASQGKVYPRKFANLITKVLLS